MLAEIKGFLIICSLESTGQGTFQAAPQITHNNEKFSVNEIVVRYTNNVASLTEADGVGRVGESVAYLHSALDRVGIRPALDQVRIQPGPRQAGLLASQL